MIYIALLRGINVGGNCKVSMIELKQIFESLGCLDTTTYINSGNIICRSQIAKNELNQKLEESIEKQFGFFVKVLLLDQNEFQSIFAAIPNKWSNDDEQKTDVMFLWKELDKESVLEGLQVTKNIETLLYTKGALIHNLKRRSQDLSKITKVAGTKTYKFMTVRNVNTVRKLKEIIDNLELV
jgi:uncharacterized protein (DUF1697 family)